MKTKSFSPILAPNESVDLSTVKYPLFASNKLDGIRCIFYKGEILSRSLKPIVSPTLNLEFENLRKFSLENNLILDGEIYSYALTFQEITSLVMTKNQALNIPKHLKFFCFDCIKDEAFCEPFRLRYKRLELLAQDCKDDRYAIVHQYLIHTKEEVKYQFDKALQSKVEGLILRSLDGHYKFGRGTIKEGIIYKVKPFVTFDAQITGVVQSTEVREGAEKKINELGRSVTSKKKDDRVLIEKASAFWIEYEGKPLKVTLAMTDEEKEEVWRTRDQQIGKWIEFKGMLIGAKDLPRHPVMLRYRKDKD